MVGRIELERWINVKSQPLPNPVSSATSITTVSKSGFWKQVKLIALPLQRNRGALHFKHHPQPVYLHSLVSMGLAGSSCFGFV